MTTDEPTEDLQKSWSQITDELKEILKRMQENYDK